MNFILVIYRNASKLTYSLIGPRQLPEGSYEKGLPVLLSGNCLVLLSGSFLGIGSLAFSGTELGVRGPCGVVHDRAKFFENYTFAPKMGEMGQKWTKYSVL